MLSWSSPSVIASLLTTAITRSAMLLVGRSGRRGRWRGAAGGGRGGGGDDLGLPGLRRLAEPRDPARSGAPSEKDHEAPHGHATHAHAAASSESSRRAQSRTTGHSPFSILASIVYSRFMVSRPRLPWMTRTNRAGLMDVAARTSPASAPSPLPPSRCPARARHAKPHDVEQLRGRSGSGPNRSASSAPMSASSPRRGAGQSLVERQPLVDLGNVFLWQEPFCGARSRSARRGVAVFGRPILAQPRREASSKDRSRRRRCGRAARRPGDCPRPLISRSRIASLNPEPSSVSSWSTRSRRWACSSTRPSAGTSR